MVRNRKARSRTAKNAFVVKKLSNPQPPVESFSPRVHTEEVAAAKAAKKTIPLRTPNPRVGKKKALFNPRWEIMKDGKYGEHALFLLPRGILALSKAIDARSIELRKLNRDSQRIFKQGSVRLSEDTVLRDIEQHQAILEKLIEQLLQIKKRAVEIPYELIGKLQVYVKQIQGCAADLISLRNQEIILLSAENAKDQAALGSRVTVEFLDRNEKKIFLIGSFYANGYGAKDELSYASPMAQAVMGAVKDSVCELEIGLGKTTMTRELRILDIS